MIWRSALNILWALVRNAFQRGHQCVRLEHIHGWGWEWHCSCGEWDTGDVSEVEAIKGFNRHTSLKRVKV